MPIDVHAHYVPPRIVSALRDRGGDYGVSLVAVPPACHECLRFDYGLQVRPFASFSHLLEPVDARVARMDSIGIDRQVLSLWPDIFGYGLAVAAGTRWHRLLNQELGAWCARRAGRFSWLASGALPAADAAARELERAVREAGAAGGIVAANIEGSNLGECDLDEYWAAAVGLGVPVFIHPVQPRPLPRGERFALNQIAQYTFDTTLAVGSLIMSGVLDRFPDLKLILSHGGGALPYLVGRFDCMHERMDRAAMGNVARAAPSAYLDRMHYDTIVHDAKALRFLAQQVGVERLVLGSDDPFPPADRDPLASLRAAGFTPDEMKAIGDDNPRRLLRV